jgi:flagellar protein FlaG
MATGKPDGAPVGNVAGNAAPETGKELPVQAPTAVAVQRALVQIQSFLRDSQRELNFQVDESSGRTVIRVVNPDSGEVVRQIPSEEVLQVAAAIEAGRLRLLDERA